jgi:hypothetical protein
MWPAIGGADGTSYFDNEPNTLDQFLTNRDMAHHDDALRIHAAGVKTDPSTRTASPTTSRPPPSARSPRRPRSVGVARADR